MKKCYTFSGGNGQIPGGDKPSISFRYPHYAVMKGEITMLPGVYTATYKNGKTYYRSNLTFRDKHISLGSFPTERKAHQAYREGLALISREQITLENYTAHIRTLSFEKAVSLLNFRDNLVYIKNPIYLYQNYFVYYLEPQLEYKFDIDDLFFYSSHKIIRRGGRLFVNEYGMQTGILSRYGIRSYGIPGTDYRFANGDITDYRYQNIIVVNRFRGVSLVMRRGVPKYKAFIHINGNFSVGIYASEEKAAIAYNKAVDLAKAAGVTKKFQQNYITDLSAREYAEIYTDLKMSAKYLQYLKDLTSD